MRRALLVAAALAGAAGGCDGVTAVLPDMAEAPDLPRWTEVVAPKVDYFGVSGSASDDVHMVGQGGTLLHWDGERLTTVDVPTKSDLRAVAAVTSARAFAVGDAGTVLAYDGTSWTQVGSGLTTNVLAAVYADANQVIAVGQGGVALRGTVTGWALVPNDSTDDLLAIGSVGGNVTAAGALGTVATFDGTGFHRQAVAGFPKTIAAMLSLGSRAILGGVEGAVFSYPGGFDPVAAMPAVYVRGLAYAPGGNVWVVGWDGLLAELVNNQPVVDESERKPRSYYGVAALATDDVWVVGTAGAVLHGPPPKPSNDMGAGDAS